jgi:xanthine phosphoribosyltransferase
VETLTVEELKKRILAEGKNLGNGILKVDSLLNHQIDPILMAAIGREIARRFSDKKITRILTAEISGIGPALMTGLALGVPIVYARKHRPITMKDPVYVESAPSHTKGGEVFLMVSPEFLSGDDHILIVDDFLATGRTIHALTRIIRQAGATLVGVGCVIEKTFEGGRAFLADLDTRVEALAIIGEMTDDQIIFAP